MSTPSFNNGPSAARPRVLVIDDDPLFRNLISSALRKDFFVLVASEGSEGYYKAIEHPPAIAVIDVQMPGWDGVRTLKAFRAHAQLSQTLIVMLTGDASRETVIAAIQSGANDYVIKTKFSREEFLSKLRRLLEGRSHGAAAPPVTSAAATPVAAPQLDSAVTDSPAAPTEADLQAVVDGWE